MATAKIPRFSLVVNVRISAIPYQNAFEILMEFRCGGQGQNLTIIDYNSSETLKDFLFGYQGPNRIASREFN